MQCNSTIMHADNYIFVNQIITPDDNALHTHAVIVNMLRWSAA